jgi:predicted protein tyrosine phosphatase
MVRAEAPSPRGSLILCSYWTAREIAPELNPAYLMSLMDAGSHYSIPTGSALREHLRIDCHDILTDEIQYPPPYVVPTAEHVREIIAAANRWDRDKSVLIHCLAGVSRSSAAALVFLAARNPGREREIALRLRHDGPWLSPNPLIVKLGDHLLGTDGRLFRAARAMGEATMRSVVGPIRVPSTFSD